MNYSMFIPLVFVACLVLIPLCLVHAVRRFGRRAMKVITFALVLLVAAVTAHEGQYLTTIICASLLCGYVFLRFRDKRPEHQPPSFKAPEPPKSAPAVAPRRNATPEEMRASAVVDAWPSVADRCDLIVRDHDLSEQYRNYVQESNREADHWLDGVGNFLAGVNARGIKQRRDVVTRANGAFLVPVVVDVQVAADVTTLLVTVPPGMHLEQVREATSKMKQTYRAFDVRVEQSEDDRNNGVMRVMVIHADPLRGMRLSEVAQRFEYVENSGVIVPPVPRQYGEIVLGRSAYGDDITHNLADASHLAIQGMTRSGKSAFTYTLLSQLVENADVQLWGIDPSKILLNVAQGLPDARLVLGKEDLDAAVTLLGDLVDLMNKRMDDLLERRIEAYTAEHFASGEVPLIVCVLEEFPGLCRAADLVDATRKPAERIKPRLLQHVETLAAESAKAGIRLVILAQRMDTKVMDGNTRGNFGTRVTMMVDNGDAIRMLHPRATPEEVAQIGLFSKGQCFVEQMGSKRGLVEMRADFTMYAAYLWAIEQRHEHASSDVSLVKEVDYKEIES